MNAIFINLFVYLNGEQNKSILNVIKKNQWGDIFMQF